MSKAKIIAGILLIFCTGIFIGAVGGHIYFRHQFRQFMKGPHELLFPKFTKKLERELDLTPEQRKKVSRIADQLREELFAFKQKHGPDLEKIVERHLSLIKAELTPEQQKKMDEIQKNIRKKWLKPPKRFGPHRDFSPERITRRLKRRLKLTDEQFEAIRHPLKKLFERQHDLFEKHWEQEPPDHRAFRTERRRLEAETDAQLEHILTAEQMEQFREMRKRWRP
ncbi:hypothetical protein DENIS_4684 [Desulfonema ishimotonii]|uniref:Periplasmic heavy metal sensor n=1 Tax=Desulfonema ishimotonii TaxID=45657 RepID=A0A401G395_9BACT|nr:hypothetical protein [Desulfonema ishimotonii]GBC63686.1 hypothetical protein DENIS_4684 [Desulfonema ishimotonii]